MKHIVGLVIFLFAALYSKAQASFEIVFDDSKSAFKIDKVDMFDVSQQEIYTKPFQKVVQFEFKKKVTDNYWIIFLSGEKRIRKQIWLNAGKIKIVAHADSLKLVIDTVYNSPFYYKSSKIFNDVNSLLSQKDTAGANDLMLYEFKENYQNPYSLAIAQKYLFINQSDKKAIIILKELFNRSSGQLDWFTSYETVKNQIEKLSVQSFLNLNEFEFTSIEGKKIKVKSDNADYVVLDFWFLLCAPCLRDHKDIHDKLDLLIKKKIELISLSTDNEIYSWKKYLSDHNYKWQNYQIGKKHKLYKQLKVGACPYYVILNKSGEVEAMYSAFSDVLKFFNI